MSRTEPPPPPHRTRPTAAGVVASAFVMAVAAIAVVLAGCALVAPPSSARAPALEGSAPSAGVRTTADPLPRPTPRSSARRPALGADDEVAGGVTVFDDDTAAVGNLDPDLSAALRRAATQAAADEVTFVVNSGWRSRQHQDRLLREAIARYGSAAEAARWVATADTSPHVHGDAVDIGGWKATAWLSRHGARYGLCQIYANEAWHYELRPEAVDHGCPDMYADPSRDPRMQR